MPAVTQTAISKAIKTAANTGKLVTLKDPEQRGLELRIWPGGSRMWTLQCHEMQQPATPLSAWAAPGHPDFAKAREECRSLRERVRQGADPTAGARQKREAAQQAQSGGKTLAGLIDIYARQKGAQRKSWPESKRRIESVFAAHLDRPWDELTLQELQRTADRWP